jgi:hypothetical protein
MNGTRHRPFKMIALRFKKRKRSIIGFQVVVGSSDGRILHNQVIIGALAHSNGSFNICQRFICKALFHQRLADQIGFIVGKFSAGFQILLPGLLIVLTERIIMC